jgi:cytochrome c556
MPRHVARLVRCSDFHEIAEDMAGSLIIIAIVAFAGCMAAGTVLAQPVADPETVIEARRALMSEMERLMLPIDLIAVGEPSDADVRSNATSIAPMLEAFPHLFPPGTNLYDQAAELPLTLALPSVWDDAATFYSLSNAAAAAAEALSESGDDSSLVAGAARLRGSCDACHALFLMPYTPATVTSEDLEFDFDALFEGIEDQ